MPIKDLGEIPVNYGISDNDLILEFVAAGYQGMENVVVTHSVERRHQGIIRVPMVAVHFYHGIPSTKQVHQIFQQKFWRPALHVELHAVREFARLVECAPLIGTGTHYTWNTGDESQKIHFAYLDYRGDPTPVVRFASETDGWGCGDWILGVVLPKPQLQPQPVVRAEAPILESAYAGVT